MMMVTIMAIVERQHDTIYTKNHDHDPDDIDDDDDDDDDGDDDDDEDETVDTSNDMISFQTDAFLTQHMAELKYSSPCWFGYSVPQPCKIRSH